MGGYEWVIGFVLCIVTMLICVRARLKCPMGGKHNLEKLPEYGSMTYGCTKCGNVFTGIDRKDI